MTNEPEIEVTVLLPCLNEAETLEVCVRKALRSLDECGVVGEVLISDNGSTDGSQEIAERAGARVVHAPVRGYGGALLNGIDQARGRYVIMADADDSYALADLGPFIEALRAGHDVVMGNRFAGGIAPGAMPPLHRYLGNPVLSWLGRRLFGLREVRDFHCGMRGFQVERIRALGLCMPGMEFASELVVRAALAGYDIAEVPTALSPDGRSRPPHLRTWRDGWRHLRFLLVFAPRKTLVRPGAALAALGLAGAAALTPGPLSLGPVRLDVATLVYACLMVLVGVQLVLFGGLAEIYGRQERLVPQRASDRWIRLLRLETSVTVGLLLFVAGGIGTGAAVARWGLDGFGDLDPHATLRVVLPSATAIALGVVVLFSGLVGSLLTLRPAHPTPALVRQPAPPRPRHLTPR
ncbi:glycosyltransferase [Micromonospora sp. CPCC 205546]|uniref:glycosyltransferase family 2 protein n=1 Tax=Micromonospora sp. CPCC 205546 TaxID=3122397 RepID=UPI002FF1B6BA